MPKIHFHNGPLDSQSLDVDLVAGTKVTQLILMSDNSLPTLYEADHELEEHDEENPLADRVLFHNSDPKDIQEFIEDL